MKIYFCLVPAAHFLVFRASVALRFTGVLGPFRRYVVFVDRLFVAAVATNCL